MRGRTVSCFVGCTKYSGGKRRLSKDPVGKKVMLFTSNGTGASSPEVTTPTSCSGMITITTVRTSCEGTSCSGCNACVSVSTPKKTLGKSKQV